jgi:hypothetical protein
VPSTLSLASTLLVVCWWRVHTSELPGALHAACPQLHHLSPKHKQDMVTAAGRLLAPGGTFVLCDIFLAPGGPPLSVVPAHPAGLQAEEVCMWW